LVNSTKAYRTNLKKLLKRCSTFGRENRLLRATTIKQFGGEIVMKTLEFSDLEVGMKVRVKKDLIVDKEYGDDIFIRGMEKYKGQIATITRKAMHHKKFDLDISHHNWTPEMVDYIPEVLFTDLKEGMKVRIKSDLIVDEQYGSDTFIDDMEEYLGEVVTIHELLPVNKKFTIEGDYDRWKYTPQMVEEIIEETEPTTLLDLKVGTKVRVKKGLEGGKTYGGIYFASNMEDHCGKVVTIAKATSKSTYKIEEDFYNWSSEMFEEIVASKASTPNEVLKALGEGNYLVKDEDCYSMEDGVLMYRNTTNDVWPSLCSIEQVMKRTYGVHDTLPKKFRQVVEEPVLNFEEGDVIVEKDDTSLEFAKKILKIDVANNEVYFCYPEGGYLKTELDSVIVTDMVPATEEQRNKFNEKYVAHGCTEAKKDYNQSK
jgi:hypothetical protein